MRFLLNSKIDLSKFLAFLEANNEKIIGKYIFNKNLNKKEVFYVISEGFLKPSDKKFQDIQLYLSQKDLLGVSILEDSTWDSDLFKLNIGKTRLLCFGSDAGLNERIILLSKLVKESAKKSYDLLFVRVPMNDMLTLMALEKQGAILTDVLVTFFNDLKDLHHPNMKMNGVEVKESSKEDEDVLVEISRKMFKYDHFHADPFLSTQLSDELYAKWMRNSLCGLADKVLVARENQEIVGFITCKIENLTQKCKFGTIDLIGVKHENRGKGIGSLLVTEALGWFRGIVPSVYVGTQVRNFNAMWLYSKLNFRPVYSEATMHLWISR
jgi:ribosomal protein S18 acetylase RimI-like enzyme